MPKTSLDVIARAYRRIGVAAEDSELTAEQKATGKTVLDALFVELQSNESVTALTDVEAVPDDLYLPLAQMLAVELAPEYGIVKPETDWFQGFRRLRRHEFPDDRSDPADLDGDGTVTAAESAAYDKAAFY